MIDRFIKRQQWLEPVADFAQGAIGGFYRVLGKPGQALKNLLHGTTLLGHPLHPAVTDIPVGAWIVGVLADWIAIANGAVPASAGTLALIVGLLGAVVSAASGYTDFHETFGLERRYAMTHGLTMSVVVVLEVVSLGFRWLGPSGLHLAAVLVSTVALLLMMAGAYLGGHLSFGMGTMVNRGAFQEGPEEFVPIGRADDFKEGIMRKADAAGTAVLVLRRGQKCFAIANVCSHAGGPLDEGTLEGDTVTCPWHGSKFCITDGRAINGPATFPQATMLVREVNGVLEVKGAG